MSMLFKLVALAIVLTLLSPVFAANTQFGQVVGAAIEDARTFCDRRPDTCRQGMELLRVTGRLVGETIANLTESATRGAPLTAEDRALAPTDAGKGDMPHNAIAGHGEDQPI